MGIDLKRFVDISNGLAKHLSCGICQQILDNAIITSCGHSFCEKCIKNSVEMNQKTCAECNKSLVKRRAKSGESVGKASDLLISINDFCFARNNKINGIISELTVFCEFDFNGCQETVQLRSLLDHMRICPERLCKVCGFLAGKAPNHNCFELMKMDRDDYQRRFQELEEENRRLRIRLEVLEEQNNYVDFHQDINGVSVEDISNF